jgi:hypothetical protein
MWVGPNTDPKTGGLALAQNSWAKLGPIYCFLFQPGPANWVGLEQVQPEAT